MEMEGKDKNIVTTAIEAGSFKTLIAAVQAAGLEKTLAEGGPFTVLAPTDEAFAKLPEGTVESLLKDTEKLASILTYHVFDGRVDSNQVVNLTSAKTLNGQEVKIKVENGKVTINDSTVVQPDIEAGNGLIHVIDAVLLPS
ncbi:MAG: fasciclin domain-containing protein [Candidatus Pacebacteria bacterium]|nr:fasciclin domain-containing protein [Candidatus Paceibacterota bacterium]